MKSTRRDLTFFLPLLAAADASAQSSPTPSKTYDYAALDVRVNGANKQRFFFNASTRTGFRVRVHATELAPNQMPHASHHHVFCALNGCRGGACCAQRPTNYQAAQYGCRELLKILAADLLKGKADTAAAAGF